MGFEHMTACSEVQRDNDLAIIVVNIGLPNNV